MKHEENVDKDSSKIYINSQSGMVFFKGEKVGALKATERRLLFCLIDKKGSEVSKDDLISIGWPNRVIVPNSLNMAIRKIRALFSSIWHDDIILTVSRVGFCLPNPDLICVFKNKEITDEQDNKESSDDDKLRDEVYDTNEKISISTSNSIVDLKTKKTNLTTCAVYLFFCGVFCIFGGWFFSYLYNPFKITPIGNELLYSDNLCSIYVYGSPREDRKKSLIDMSKSIIKREKIPCNDKNISIFFDSNEHGKIRANIALFSACIVGKNKKYTHCENFRSINGN